MTRNRVIVTAAAAVLLYMGAGVASPQQKPDSTQKPHPPNFRSQKHTIPPAGQSAHKTPPPPASTTPTLKQPPKDPPPK